MNAIECESLVKKQGQIKALNELSVTIKKNTITGLVGRNGAGKTTLLKILAGFWEETSGDVHASLSVHLIIFSYPRIQSMWMTK